MISILVAAVVAAPTMAHPGHLADFAGHDHWVAGAAIGAAIALGIWGALKGKTTKADDEVETEVEGEEQAA